MWQSGQRGKVSSMGGDASFSEADFLELVILKDLQKRTSTQILQYEGLASSS